MSTNSTNLPDSFYEMDFSSEEDDPYAWPKYSDLLAEISTDHNDLSPVTPKSDTIPLDLNFGHGSSDVSDSLAEISTVSDHSVSSPVTPKSDTVPLALNFGHGSSDVSLNHDSDSLAEISTDHSDSSPVTPKSGTVPLALNLGHGSSDVSLDHGRDFSCFEFDFEAEAVYSSLNHDLAAEKHISYGELMKKYVQCEEELWNTCLKLRESEQEIEKQKGESEKRESAVLLAENLHAELETAQREIETRDIEIETEKSLVLELQRQVFDLETKLWDSGLNFENLVEELMWSKECLYASDAEISKLTEMLYHCQQSFSIEKTKLQTDIGGLLGSQVFLEARVKELESHGAEWQRKEVELQDEIDELKIDWKIHVKFVELMNRDFRTLAAEKNEVSAELDNLKEKMRTRDIHVQQVTEQLIPLLYKMKVVMAVSRDTVEELRGTVKELEKQAELQRNVISEGEEEKREVTAEKDEVSAELEYLRAEMISRDIHIEQMEEQLKKLGYKQIYLASESRNAKNMVEELRGMVKELEKEAELQRNVIAEGEEEKRELSFSLDHHKGEYRQLLRFL